jgi:hypothetical protein
LLLGKQILFPQQCFHGWANRETFEETSRITNVSATMFPSLPRALVKHEYSVCNTIYKTRILATIFFQDFHHESYRTSHAINACLVLSTTSSTSAVGIVERIVVYSRTEGIVPAMFADSVERLLLPSWCTFVDL